MMKNCWAVLGLFAVAALPTVAVGQITGTIKLSGPAPEMAEVEVTPDCAAEHPDPIFEETVVVGEAGELQNVVVSLKELPAGAEPKAPTEPVVLDQVGCRYVPHVVTVMVGQPVTVKNSDKFMHNVHGLCNENEEFNFAQITIDPGRPIGPFENPETFRLKCDVHPWMSAHIRVLEHPYAAVTDDKGQFSLAMPEGVADGQYTVVLWHERYGEKEHTVNVTGGKGALDASVDAEAAMAPAEASVVLASTDGAPATGADCDCKTPTTCPTDRK